MVHVETNPGKHNAHGGPEENVECVMAVIGPSRRGDEEGRRGRHEREDHHQDRRRGPALAYRRVILHDALTLDGEMGKIRESDGEFGAQPQ